MSFNCDIGDEQAEFRGRSSVVSSQSIILITSEGGDFNFLKKEMFVIQTLIRVPVQIDNRRWTDF